MQMTEFCSYYLKGGTVASVNLLVIMFHIVIPIPHLVVVSVFVLFYIFTILTILFSLQKR